MMRDWKPGDVAMVTNRYTATNIAICSVDRDLDLAWRFGCTDATEPVGAPARPLVVIDPDDREQVNRLADLFCEARWCHVKDGNTDDCDPLTRSSMRDALAAYADPTPPRPDEPTGRYAEVQNAEGMTYYRSPAGSWRRSSDDLVREWRAIGAVRVLSEGVTQ